MTKRAKETKEAFITAALELHRQDLSENISVRTIAKSCGYSYGTIYNYFIDMDDLNWHVVLRVYEELADIIAHSESPGKEPRARLEGLLLAYIDFFLHYPGFFRLLYLEERKPPREELGKSLRSIRIKEQLLRGLAPLLPEEKVPMAGELISNALHGSLLFALQLKAYDRPQLEAVIKDSLTLLLEGGRKG